MTESESTRRLCEELEQCGCLVKPHVASMMNQPGWPDRWVCHRLWHGHLEMKAGDGELSPLQRRRLSEIERRQPGTAFVLRFVRDEEGRPVMQVERSDGHRYGSVESARHLMESLAGIRDRLLAEEGS